MGEPAVAKLLESAKVVYSAGFFITACSDAVKKCVEHCLEYKKTYALVRFRTLGVGRCMVL